MPYYVSDWVDAWDYRVVPATVYMYFANILPALAFSLDMFQRIGTEYGVNETLLASVLGAVVFSLFAAQPIVIVGVTGPITVFNYTVYDIIEPTGVNYIGFMAWIGMSAPLYPFTPLPPLSYRHVPDGPSFSTGSSPSQTRATGFAG